MGGAQSRGEGGSIPVSGMCISHQAAAQKSLCLYSLIGMYVLIRPALDHARTPATAI